MVFNLVKVLSLPLYCLLGISALQKGGRKQLWQKSWVPHTCRGNMSHDTSLSLTHQRFRLSHIMTVLLRRARCLPATRLRAIWASMGVSRGWDSKPVLCPSILYFDSKHAGHCHVITSHFHSKTLRPYTYDPTPMVPCSDMQYLHSILEAPLFPGFTVVACVVMHHDIRLPF